LGAYHLPDYAEFKDEIAEELARRSVSSSRIDQWTQPATNLVVPLVSQTVTAPSEFEKLAKNQSGYFLALRFVAIGLVCAVAVALALVAASYVAWEHLSQHSTSNALMRMSAGVLKFIVIPLAAAAVGMIVIGGFQSRASDLRIALLRPFDQPQMTAALKSVVLQHLAPLGHVITLSDTNYKPNPFVRLFDALGTGVRYVVAPAFRPSQRIATISSERTYRAFAVGLSRRLRPAFRRVVTGGQAANIKSTNLWWQWCVDLLIHTGDFIVMDVSRVSAGSAWEVGQLARRDLLSKCLFIAQQDHMSTASVALRGLIPAGTASPIYAFRPSGEFADAAGFATALHSQVSRTLAARSE
jgi:hypothetical protein